MRDWLQKLMAGDDSAIPSGAKVERDALGRVSGIQYSPSLGSLAEASPAYPPLTAVDSLAPRLDAACDWLVAQNVRLARERGIGLEHYSVFDPDECRLSLIFEQGDPILAAAQIIGTFDPHDGSFLWGWADPSIAPENCKAATLLRIEGERLGLSTMVTPRQTVKFDAMIPLLALAAHNAGSDGVYRHIVEDVSAFLSIGFDGPSSACGPADQAILEAAHDLVMAYDAEMLPIDQECRDREDDFASLREQVGRKVAVYGRFWSRDDDYWEPCSIEWPSEHDPGQWNRCFTVPHPHGGAVDVKVCDVLEIAFRIEVVAGTLKITDRLLGWGSGFVWPSRPAKMKSVRA